MGCGDETEEESGRVDGVVPGELECAVWDCEGKVNPVVVCEPDLLRRQRRRGPVRVVCDYEIGVRR